MPRIWDRARKIHFEEKVLGGAFVDWGYGSTLGRALSGSILIQRALSKAFGALQSNPLSKARIAPFVRDYGVVMDDFVEPEGGFKSFNDFFVRALRPGVRTFPSDPALFGSPAEGRLTVFAIEGEETRFTVKGRALSIANLVGSRDLAANFVGGTAFVFRLCPVDYHRFHFPDEGTAGPSLRLGRALHSVNPAAHAAVDDIFLQNERHICRFESTRFGQMLLIEVGATCVGRIVQSYTPGMAVARGAEKGYFAFGGSSTIVLSRPGALRADADLLERTAAGEESLVRLGEVIARK